LTESFEWPEQDPGASALFFLTNPNAPTSLRFARERVERFCRGFKGVVLIDEAYVDFAEADCMELARSLPNVLVMRTLSKSYSLAGIRFGYVVGSKVLIEALFKIKDSYNLDRMTQVVAGAALGDQAHMRANVARIKATRARLAGELTRRGFEVCASETNFLWARPTAMPAREIFEMLKEAGVLIRYFPGERTGAYVRITVGTDVEIDRLLEVLP
jgi:histidinol-phosphate aminotransferase